MFDLHIYDAATKKNVNGNVFRTISRELNADLHSSGNVDTTTASSTGSRASWEYGKTLNELVAFSIQYPQYTFVIVSQPPGATKFFVNAGHYEAVVLPQVTFPEPKTSLYQNLGS